MENRRYVGKKETIGFVLWDASQSFNINLYTDRFITNIVQVDLSLQLIVQAVNGVWDVINDIFMGAIVDKTRTRWGKFRPYLLLLAIPGCVLTCMYWLMPYLFEGKTSLDMTKFIFYFALTVIREGVSTFQSISTTGLMSTVTPHPIDRTRLITIANFASTVIGERLPELITTALLDFVDNGVMGKNQPKGISYLHIFVGMGVFTTLVSSAMSMFFFLNSRERVMQSVEPPSIKQGIKSIINNKPILLLTLSDFLSSFGIGGNKQDYYIDVLHFASMKILVGIPSVPIEPASYAYVPYLRERFSSKTLYLVSKYFGSFENVIIFLVGCIGMNRKTKHGGIYQNRNAMFVVMTIEEFLWSFTVGTRSVITTELYNESMDYCEWKNGYRTEAMTSVAKGLAAKIARQFGSLFSTAIKKSVRYDQGAYMSGREQNDGVKFYLFAMFTIMPALTGCFGIFPMLFYDLGGEKKNKMYRELTERRQRLQQVATTGDMEELKKASMEITK